MPQYNSSGLSVQGTLPGYTGYSLVASDGGGFFKGKLVTKSNLTATGYIKATGKITTSTGFYGNGTNVTNTMSGDSTSGHVSDIIGLDATGTITVVNAIRNNNGRPTFSTTTGTITMPTTAAVKSIADTAASSAITSALGKNGSIAKAIEDALSGYAKSGKYYLGHATQSNIITSISKDSDTFTGTATVDGKNGKASIEVSNLVGTVNKSEISNFYIEI
jgi:hypothetical protein